MTPAAHAHRQVEVTKKLVSTCALASSNERAASAITRRVIPKLADHYRVVAPDLPGFGQSDLPSREQFKYSFSNLATVIARFTEALELRRFAMYVFDYGSPTGLRMALDHPERVTAIITQNGNAYVEGLISRNAGGHAAATGTPVSSD